MQRSRLGSAILLLGAATALIHWYLLLGFFDIPFLLNGLGYFALLGALFLELPWFRERRRLVAAALMIFTLASIVAWIAVGDRRAAIAYVDKAIEVALLAALWRYRLALPDTQAGRSAGDSGA